MIITLFNYQPRILAIPAPVTQPTLQVCACIEKKIEMLLKFSSEMCCLLLNIFSLIIGYIASITQCLLFEGI